MKKNFLPILAVLTAAVMVLACTPKQTASGTETQGGEKITLRYSWWGGEARHEATLAAMEAWSKKNPHIIMEGEYSGFEGYHEKLLTQLASGTAPDIAQVDYKMSHDVISQGHPFINMNTLTGTIDTTYFNMDFANAYGSDGDYLVGLPAGVSGVGIYYNADLAENLGLNLSNDMVWEDLIELGKEVQRKDPSKRLIFIMRDVYGYIFKSMIWNWNGQPIILDDYTLGFSRNDLLRFMNYVRELIDTGTAASFEEMIPYQETHPDSNPHWLNGEYVMFPHFASIAPTVLSASPFKIDCVRWPIAANPKDPGVLGTPSAFVGVTKDSKYPEEAAKFIDFMLNDPEGIMIVKDARGIPVNTEAATMLEEAGILQPVAVKMTKQVLESMGRADNALSLDPEVMAIIYDYIYEAGLKESTPEEATDGMIGDLQNLLARKKQ